MMHRRFTITLAPGLFATLALALTIAVGLAACGASGGGSGGGGLYGSSGGSGGSNNNSGGGSASTACASGSAAICTRSVKVNGVAEPVLVTPAGRTLYYFSPDSVSKLACTGSCVTLWPPLISSSSSVAPISGLTGALATVSRNEGTQITYSGHPLYTFSKDAAPGDAKGNGIFGKWFVATPTLAPGAGSGGYNSGY